MQDERRVVENAWIRDCSIRDQSKQKRSIGGTNNKGIGIIMKERVWVEKQARIGKILQRNTRIIQEAGRRKESMRIVEEVGRRKESTIIVEEVGRRKERKGTG